MLCYWNESIRLSYAKFVGDKWRSRRSFDEKFTDQNTTDSTTDWLPHASPPRPPPFSHDVEKGRQERIGICIKLGIILHCNCSCICRRHHRILCQKVWRCKTILLCGGRLWFQWTNDDVVVELEGGEMQSLEWIQFTMNERNKFLGKAQDHLSPKASSLFLSFVLLLLTDDDLLGHSAIQPFNGGMRHRENTPNNLPMKHKSSPSDEDTLIENNWLLIACVEWTTRRVMWTEWADVRVLCFYIVPIAGYLQVVKLAEKERRECKFRFIKFHSDGINHPPSSSLWVTAWQVDIPWLVFVLHNG